MYFDFYVPQQKPRGDCKGLYWICLINDASAMFNNDTRKQHTNILAQIKQHPPKLQIIYCKLRNKIFLRFNFIYYVLRYKESCCHRFLHFVF